MASTTVRRPGRFLPPDPRTAEPYRLTPKLALRLGILGALALAAFGVLFLRLWALQVLSGTQYLRAAENNQLRTLRIQAARGPILDSKGRKIVTNVGGTAIQLWPADLPKTWPEQRAEIRALSALVGVPVKRIYAGIHERAGDPLTPVTVKDAVRNDQIDYLYEHAAEFPGVHIAQTYERHYPYGLLAAQTLGYVTEISPEQLKERQRAGYKAGDQIGQTGIESAFDRYLRGHAGVARLRVDSLGRPRSVLATTQQSQPGEAVRLTLDVKLQRAAERALQFGIARARANNEWAANGGAIVALDPRDGAIRALASAPTYKPSVFVGHVSARKLARQGLTNATAPEQNYPAVNRALAATYPAGSTFKPVVALAALQEGLISPETSLLCSGSYTYTNPQTGYKQTFQNWNPLVYQSMTLRTALAYSCDTYFYELGFQFYNLKTSPLQEWARRFGFGKPTGIDVGGEVSGLVPTPAWRKRAFTRKNDPNWRIDSLWKPGDSIQLAIGQKDLLVTPLQMARFYALIANGGKLVTPHVVQDVEQPGNNGAPSQVLRTFSEPPPPQIDFKPGVLDSVREGLYLATHASYGTSVGVFGSFPVEIAGKTGTAEHTGRPDQSWYVALAPWPDPKYVVAVTDEAGGFGADTAAPMARRILAELFNVKENQLVQGGGPSD